MDEELKVGILEKNGNGQGDSNRIVNRNTQVHSAVCTVHTYEV